MIETRLRKLRLNHALKQSDIAEHLGITRASYTYYEQGQRQPNPEMLIRLAEFFQVTVDYLAGRTEDPSPMPEADSTEVLLLKYYRPVDSRGKSAISDCALYEQRLQAKKN